MLLNENEYIYKRLKFLSDEIENLINVVEGVVAHQEELIKIIDQLTTKVNVATSPETIRKINKYNEMNDMVDKINLMKKLTKK